MHGNNFYGTIGSVKILAVSDQVIDRMYMLVSSGHFQDINLILGCGDMPYTYLEYIVTMLNVPMYYVPGNHDPEHDLRDKRSRAEGGSNLDLAIDSHKNFLIGGFGGCVRYRPDGINQYTQAEAYMRAFQMLPHLLPESIPSPAVVAIFKNGAFLPMREFPILQLTKCKWR